MTAYLDALIIVASIVAVGVGAWWISPAWGLIAIGCLTLAITTFAKLRDGGEQ